MILSDNSKRISFPAWLKYSIGIALLAFLAFWFFQPKQVIAHGPDTVFCDAETVKDEVFVSGEYTFGKGKMQSDDWAYSGSYSCKVDKGSGLQYGFGFKLRNAEPGALYHVQVWRFNPSKILNYLTVQEDVKGGTYLTQMEPVERLANGWERVEIYFRSAKKETDNNYKIYVYTQGQSAVYYDDLLVEKVSLDVNNQYKLPIVHLNIGKDGMQKLEQKRKEALQAGILVSADDDWVKGKMYSGDPNEEMPVELRLKGDWLDHLRGKKWSFRVAMKPGGSWRGMTTFSFHTPSARSHLMEWMLHEFWHQEDVLTTRYDFAEVYLNGESLGIYAYEEHFEKQLVESKSRREGPILRFSEDAFWANMERQLRMNGALSYNFQQEIGSYQNALIQPFNTGQTMKDSVLFGQYIQAKKLLEQFRTGGLKASDVFDIERAAKYYAISDVFGAYHGIVWHNQRYYYNPIENKMEPIGYDGFSDTPYKRHTFLGQGLSHPGKLQSGPVYASLFQDADFAEAYIKYLELYTRPDFMLEFFDSIQPAILGRQLALNEEMPNYRVDIPEILAGARYVRALIFPYDEYSVGAYRDEKGAIFMTNYHELPIQITGYSRSNNGGIIELEQPQLLSAASPREFLTRLRTDTTRFTGWDEIRRMIGKSRTHHYTRVPFPATVPNDAKVVFFEVLGLDSTYQTPVKNGGEWLINTPNQELFPEGMKPTGAGFVTQGSEVVFQAGKTQTAEPILIPPGYRVHFEPGVELDLIRGAKFISKSPVFMAGMEELPIQITSSDGSAAGFTVLETDQQSSLTYTSFSGFNTLAYKGWNLTGAVTFYESDVRMEHVSFVGNHCEDGLNIIRSEIDINHILVNNTPFDGFDCDFCKGTVQNSVFSNTGNDGLDFSGSILEVKYCQLLNIGDKGVSVGEASEVAIFQTGIRNAQIGTASKDRSILVVDELELTDCDLGFAAYQKKPEFGGGTIIVRRYTEENIKRLYQVLDGSRIDFSGVD